MGIMVINDEQFETEVKKSNGIVVVDFFAEWCAPCKSLVVTLEEFAKTRSDIKVFKVDCDDSADTARDQSIKTLPTLKVFKNGNLVDTVHGIRSVQELTDLVQKHI